METLRTLQGADYLVIGFYLLFMMALGPVFKSFNRNASDYFRGGGNMSWWIACASMFMTGFSAWTYTGAAGKVYSSGIFFLTLTVGNFCGAIFTAVFTAHRFRQMRVITANEAVRNRFGKSNEQIMTWLPMPFNILFGGISLYTIAMFMSCVFTEELGFLRGGFFESVCAGLSLDTGMIFLILALALVIIFMTVLGGSWAATAGDFVQMLILVTITVTVAVLILMDGRIGGLSGLVEKVSKRPELVDISQISRMWIFIPYLITLILNQTILQNSLLAGAGKFVFVKNGRDARKISIITWLAAIPQTFLFMVPALACVIIYPNLAEYYPNLPNPQEGAYIQIARMVLPSGLLGLLVCAIFAATLTSMNSGLNGTAGSVIRNIYLPLFNPKASDQQQLKLGRVMVFVLGTLYALVAIFFSTLKQLPLYELILLAATSTGIPQAVPLFLGMFSRRAPDWSVWSTLAIGFGAAIGLNFLLTADTLKSWTASCAIPLSGSEINDLKLAITTGTLITVSVGWFYLSMLVDILLKRRRSADAEARVQKFFTEMATPVADSEHSTGAYNNDARQFDVIGKLCMVYGVAILLILVFDNTFAARICILAVGGFITLLGTWLMYLGRRLQNKFQTDNATSGTPECSFE